jgi:ribonuclease HI
VGRRASSVTFPLLLPHIHTSATKRITPSFRATAMVRPSRFARKARRAHERQQEEFRKQNLPSCEGCDLCSATKAREIEKAIRDSHVPFSQRQEHKQSPHSKLRQYLKKNLFEADIVITPKQIALTEVANEVDLGAEQDRSVYWTDGSRLKDSCCGIGVAYRSSTETWAELSWSVRGSIKTHVLEIYAIAKALEIARERCRNVEAEQRPSSVCIYSDCSGALEYFLQIGQTLAGLRRLPCGEELVGPGILAAEELSALKIAVELRYVPGHTGILGNVKADRAARRGAKHSVGKRKAGRLMTQCGSRGRHGI